MQRLSSKATFFHKRILPILMFGFLVVFVVISFGASSARNEPPPLLVLVVPIIMAIVFFFTLKKLVFDLVDEVWDAGDELLVRNRSIEDRIALSDITNVNYSPYINPPRVTLSLRRPSFFGAKISFMPPIRFVPFTTSPVIDELIARIDAARRRDR